MTTINSSTTISGISGSTVTINGQSFKGGDVVIANGRVYVDGKAQTVQAGPEIKIEIEGAVHSVSTTSGDVSINGTVERVKTMSGDVEAKAITGNAETMSGDIIVKP
ncbi:hypothetical protein J8Z28_20375 [Pseudoalteromonas sp. SCSIO 43088]|uniref:hypothetical protein n=1 Tax=Pseudoalteromonas sp. SCSIO 43088 TaxID=2822846 RepID=UPI00202B8FE1|nr:hypothetical protein [Pseudoalteromonas sp. SCSIO 43088]URQ88244.1 hypothetical protein J8Z28_20375 [Pseudoalteromonas sp. SCSIO 43088]